MYCLDPISIYFTVEVSALNKLVCADTKSAETFISTYNARKFAFPDLVGQNDKGKNVLFGGYPKDIDKKQVIWEHVNDVCPEVSWLYGKTGALKKENYDRFSFVVIRCRCSRSETE